MGIPLPKFLVMVYIIGEDQNQSQTIDSHKSMSIDSSDVWLLVQQKLCTVGHPPEDLISAADAAGWKLAVCSTSNEDVEPKKSPWTRVI